MKRAGDLCKMDNLGRIVIPVRLRRKFDLKPNGTLEVFTEGESIILQRYIPTCVFCGSDEDLEPFDDKSICHDCIKKISSLNSD